MAIVDGGRHSVTHYDTLEAFRSATLLEVHLETGRTHQIRVHAAAIGHPCVGDPLYGGDPVLAARLGLERQWLHAVELGFDHPGSGRTRPIPARPTPTIWPTRWPWWRATDRAPGSSTVPKRSRYSVWLS